MRIRTIKPDFYKHEGLFELECEMSAPIRLAYTGLWGAADREGRFKWRARQLKVEILPYDGVDFERVLHALATRGFLVKYRVGHEWYGFIPSFKNHQIINNKERASEIPALDPEKHEIQAFDANFNALVTRAPRVAVACRKEGKGKEGNKEGKGDPAAPPKTEPVKPPEAREPEPEPTPPSPHVQFIDDWALAFKAKFGFDYQFGDGRDGKAVKELLGTGTSAQELLATAANAWARGKTDQRAWACKNHAGTLHGFLAYLNQIRIELNQGKPLPEANQIPEQITIKTL